MSFPTLVRINRDGSRTILLTRGKDGLPGPQGSPGDVTGPVSSEVGNIAVFSSTGGNEIEDSGAALSDFTTTAALDILLGNKQDTEAGKGLSTEDFTTDEKTKLDAMSQEGYVGRFDAYADLIDAFGTADDGDFALVGVVGDPLTVYFWDNTNGTWAGYSPGAQLDGAGIATLLFAEPNTNNFDDASVAKLDSAITQQDAANLVASVASGVVVEEPTTARTLTLADLNKYIRLTNASSTTITLPNDTTVLWTANPEIFFYLVGTVAPTFNLGVGVTLTNGAAVSTLVQYQRMSVKRTASSSWDLTIF